MFWLGHAGLPLALAYVLAMRRSAWAPDYRFLLLGTLLPDLVDKLLLGAFGLGVSKGIAHALWFGVVFAVAGLHPGARRPLWSLAAGVLSHQVLDRPWDWWDQFVYPLGRTREPVGFEVLRSFHSLSDPYVVAGELLGALAIALVASHARAWTARARAAFLRRGELAPPEPNPSP